MVLLEPWNHQFDDSNHLAIVHISKRIQVSVIILDKAQSCFHHGPAFNASWMKPASYQGIQYKLSWKMARQDLLAKISFQISDCRSIMTMTSHEVLVKKLLAKKPTSS